MEVHIIWCRVGIKKTLALSTHPQAVDPNSWTSWTRGYLIYTATPAWRHYSFASTQILKIAARRHANILIFQQLTASLAFVSSSLL